MDDVYLVVHGHFYQPPRENPWTETVEREPSASPFHNWNARIADECYHRNGRARVFNDAGMVTRLVNNYELMSFNFGPTLMSWLEEHDSDAYQRMIAADAASARARGGHGNAIAQAYGHAILPLCNDRDRRTQVLWGVRDFAFRFGREPEAMWLPETAIDMPTVDTLIDAGLRYVILAPRQCSAIRALGDNGRAAEGTPFEAVGDRVDPRRAYRVFSETDPSRYIDAFFYDGPVSHAVSFERLLSSSHSFIDKLAGAAGGGSGPRLVHVAVDGETFGHHQRHAQRALGYALDVLAEQRGFKVTNCGAFLERHPPRYEATLQLGPDGEGSAWSCAHGVGRWCRDCGCHAGAPAGWNQAWRAPLREMADTVRDRAAEVFADLGGDLFVDPDRARNEYVDLLLDGSDTRQRAFLDRHGRSAAHTKATRVMRLCEMSRHALLASTSCGWFFNDISGLEAVQVMRYAARAVQLIEEISGRTVESDVLDVLAKAQSNIPGMGNGADIYRQKVRTASVDERSIVAQHAITGVHAPHDDIYSSYGFCIREINRRTLASGMVRVIVGRVQIERLRTSEQSDLVYALVHFGSHEFHCAVRPFTGQRSYRQLIERLQSLCDNGHTPVAGILRTLDAHFGESTFSLADLLTEEREQLLHILFGHLEQSFGQLYGQLYDMQSKNILSLVAAGFNMPREVRMVAEYTLSHRLAEAVEAAGGSIEPGHYGAALRIVEEAHAGGHELDKSRAEELLGRVLERLSAKIEANAHELAQLLELAEQLELSMPLERAQELVLDQIAEAPERFEHAVSNPSSVLGGVLTQLCLAPDLRPRAVRAADEAAASASAAAAEGEAAGATTASEREASDGTDALANDGRVGSPRLPAGDGSDGTAGGAAGAGGAAAARPG